MATNLSASSGQLSQKEADIRMMCAAEVHLGTKNCNYQMERYVFKRCNDECPLCQTTRNAKEIIGKEIAYTVSAEDIRRELGISLFGEKTQEDAELPKIKKACEKCQHPELVYTTRQTRSADEGQTTYYTCPNCCHRFIEG